MLHLWSILIPELTTTRKAGGTEVYISLGGTARASGCGTDSNVSIALIGSETGDYIGQRLEVDKTVIFLTVSTQ